MFIHNHAYGCHIWGSLLQPPNFPESSMPSLIHSEGASQMHEHWSFLLLKIKEENAVIILQGDPSPTNVGLSLNLANKGLHRKQLVVLKFYQLFEDKSNIMRECKTNSHQFVSFQLLRPT